MLWYVMMLLIILSPEYCIGNIKKSKSLIERQHENLRSLFGKKRTIEMGLEFDPMFSQRVYKNNRDSLYQDEAELLEKVLLNLLDMSDGMRAVAIQTTRAVADTIAGFSSASIKGVGAIFNLGANFLFEFSMNLLEFTEIKLHPIFRSTSMTLVHLSKNSAKVILWPIGKTCILSGEVIESMSIGLGQAVEDSFFWIEIMHRLSRRLVCHLLNTDMDLFNYNITFSNEAQLDGNADHKMDSSEEDEQNNYTGDKLLFWEAILSFGCYLIEVLSTAVQLFRPIRHICIHFIAFVILLLNSAIGLGSSISYYYIYKPLWDSMARDYLLCSVLLLILYYVLTKQTIERDKKNNLTNCESPDFIAPTTTDELIKERYFYSLWRSQPNSSIDLFNSTPSLSTLRDYTSPILSVERKKSVYNDKVNKILKVGQFPVIDMNEVRTMKQTDSPEYIIGDAICESEDIVSDNNRSLIETPQQERSGEHKKSPAKSCYSNLKQQSHWTIPIIVSAVISVWMYLVSVETVKTERMLNQVRIKTMQEMLSLQANWRNLLPSGELNEIDSEGTLPIYQEQFLPNYESSIWLNIALRSLWLINGKGGMGPYISETTKEILNTELAKVPHGVANLRVKQFVLGSQPPLLNWVRIHSFPIHAKSNDTWFNEGLFHESANFKENNSQSNETYSDWNSSLNQTALEKRMCNVTDFSLNCLEIDIENDKENIDNTMKEYRELCNCTKLTSMEVDSPQIENSETEGFEKTSKLYDSEGEKYCRADDMYKMQTLSCSDDKNSIHSSDVDDDPKSLSTTNKIIDKYADQSYADDRFQRNSGTKLQTPSRSKKMANDLQAAGHTFLNNIRRFNRRLSEEYIRQRKPVQQQDAKKRVKSSDHKLYNLYENINSSCSTDGYFHSDFSASSNIGSSNANSYFDFSFAFWEWAFGFSSSRKDRVGMKENINNVILTKTAVLLERFLKVGGLAYSDEERVIRPASAINGMDPRIGDLDAALQKGGIGLSTQRLQTILNSLLGISRSEIPFKPLISATTKNLDSDMKDEELDKDEKQKSVQNPETDRAVIDFGFVYESKDMDIIISLRAADIKSILPEVTVSVTGIKMDGKLRLDIALTEDYPFLGNASVSFLDVPHLDFSISSFGGVDLSSIPLAYYWINATFTWLLTQYTYPLSTELDLRINICPLCDAPLPPTPIEVMTEFYKSIQQSVSRALAGTLQSFLTFTKSTVKE